MRKFTEYWETHLGDGAVKLRMGPRNVPSHHERFENCYCVNMHNIFIIVFPFRQSSILCFNHAKKCLSYDIVQARRTSVPVRATYVTPVPIGPLFRVFTFYFGWHILASLNHKIVDTFCKFF